MFCVECGTEGPTTDSLCAGCFSKKHRLVDPPAHLDVPRCKECGRLHLGPAWTESDLDAAIPDVLRLQIPPRKPFSRVTFTHVARPEDANNYLLTVKAASRYENLEQVQDFHTRLRLKPSLCDVCSKQRSRYYEGILQVRGDGRNLTAKEIREVRTFVQVRVDRARDTSGEFVSRIEDMHGGLDFYLSSNSLGKILARELADTFGGSVSSSPKLYGQRGGKELYRVTTLVRLPAAQKGDVVRHKGKLHEVIKVGAFVTLRDLESGQQRRFKPKDLRGARRIDAERFETNVERMPSGELTVTHPESGATRSVVSGGNTAVGRAAVVWTADGAYVSALPPDGSKD